MDWRAGGYLFVAGPDDVGHLRANYATQVEHGVDAEWLEPADLGERFPEIRVDDLAGAVLSPRDGWLNPRAFFAGVQARARAAGVTVRHDRVEEILVGSGQVRGVRLADGSTVRADAVFNCAGTWAPQLAAQVGMRLPVEPMRRHENFHVASGFSGHGFMHALGVGRALAELLLTGAYQTIDLSRLGYSRVERDEPYPELGVR